MADEDPSVFDTSWENWNHPKRAIAAIAMSIITVVIPIRYFTPTILDSGVHPILIVGSTGICIMIIGGGAVAIMARFD